MPLAVCASHTPLMTRGEVDPAIALRVKAAFTTLAGAVRSYEPDCIVQFSPNHCNGFFYDLMPQFCVGAGAESIGDWGGTLGALPPQAWWRSAAPGEPKRSVPGCAVNQVFLIRDGAPERMLKTPQDIIIV